MNRREFLCTSLTLAVAAAGVTSTANLLQSSPVMAEATQQVNLETWLLATGQNELPPDVYALTIQKLGGERRIFMPVVQR